MTRRPSGPGTFWNGQAAPAEKVWALVGSAPQPSWWCAGMEGRIRPAVVVKYAGQTHVLDDADGSGWFKVTDGFGSSQHKSLSLPADSEILSRRLT